MRTPSTNQEQSKAFSQPAESQSAGKVSPGGNAGNQVSDDGGSTRIASFAENSAVFLAFFVVQPASRVAYSSKKLDIACPEVIMLAQATIATPAGLPSDAN